MVLVLRLSLRRCLPVHAKSLLVYSSLRVFPSSVNEETIKNKSKNKMFPECTKVMCVLLQIILNKVQEDVSTSLQSLNCPCIYHNYHLSNLTKNLFNTSFYFHLKNTVYYLHLDKLFSLKSKSS